MAITLLEGQQYALNNHNHSVDKTLIFVKLTDSALNAIENYVNNKANVSLNCKPTIEFRTNDSQGVISLPIRSSNYEDEKQRFGFTLSNVEAEGPQGGYECIRQSKNNIMESFGSMNHKMLIHASEDSYQKTKVKMAVVEQESKKNCTKVIKASGPNVGRKVKGKRPFSTSNRFANNHNLTQTQSYNKVSSHSPTVKLNNPTVNGNSIPIIKTNANHNVTPGSDSIKKGLRETIIHILALRPHTKSELLSRLSNEGYKDVDKKELSLLLNNVSMLKDSAYHLTKSSWTDVEMDWQNYSTEEKESIKYKNALLQVPHSVPHSQIGISPLSDSSSMQAFSSPNNVDCNSPSFSPANSKRIADNSALLAKKQKKLISSHNSFNTNTNNVKSPSTKLQTNGYHDVLNGWANKPSSPERSLINSKIDANHSSLSSHTSVNKTDCTIDLRAADSSQNNVSHPSPDSCMPPHQQFQSLQNNRINCNFITNDNYSKKNTRDSFRYGNGFLVSSTTNGSGSINSSPNSSPESGTGSHDGSLLSSSNSYNGTNEDTADYLLKYIKITNPDQRAQYKRDFNREYEEYRRLHRYIENVGTKFSELEIRLNTKVEGSDDWNKLIDQIVKEYEETKNSMKFQDARKRMFYLHDKLAHIKNLIVEFDRSYNYKDKNRISHKIQMKTTQLS